MNLRTLLLGSAAALIAASPGLAADAIVAAEPEPVEYVRVCDAFGAGYFYIPGTEACLRFGGYVRFRVYSSETEDSYFTATRARLNVNVKSDTELGELTGHIRLQADNNTAPTADASYNMDQAYIQLGGLFAGYYETAWVTTTNGGASGYGGHGIYDGYYGFAQRNQLQYQFNGASWFGAISLEDDGDTTSWTPDVIGRLGGVFGGVTVFGVLAYNQANVVNVDEWSAKLGLNTDIGSAGNLRVQGFYASGNTQFGVNINGNTAEWSVLASYSHDFTETVTGFVGGQYGANFYDATNTQTNADGWYIHAGVNWTPVTNFNVQADFGYQDLDAAIDDNNPGWFGAIELQRSF